MASVRLAVVGAGQIGRRHAELVAAEPGADLLAIVDPAPVGQDLARRLGTAAFASFAAMLAAHRPDGVIIATPNRTHAEIGLEAVAAGLPALVEKPIADDVPAATSLVEAAGQAGVPLLVGHHRRYNPMIRKAREIIDSGRLGRVLAIHGSFWLTKPDDYFDTAWRREKGAGPVLINLIHDIDLFRYLCGEVVAVQAQESGATRGNAVEDTAVVLLRFASGALGTFTVSDAVAAPWSWELTAGENPVYPRQDEACYHVGGTHGALAIPQLQLWSYSGRRSWWEPLVREQISFEPENPLRLQIRHFCDVVRGQAAPAVSGEEGLASLKVVQAIKQAAATGTTVTLG